MILKADEYLVPAHEHQSELKVKGSRFICTVVPCLTKEDAEKKYARLKKEFYDATHNCFAWRVDDTLWRYSDDGEPSGTAGRPILQAIDAGNFKEILCVVTRYFGGTKLGTGGLIRAYGEAALGTINNVKPFIKTIRVEVHIAFEYALENLVRKTITEFDGRLVDSNYGEEVQMNLAIPKSLLKEFCTRLIELSNSAIKVLS